MAFTLTDEERTESLTANSTTINRTFLCTPWRSRHEAALLLLGSVRLVGGRLVRILPARDPDLRFAFCQQVDIAPIEDDALEKRVAVPNPLIHAADYPGGARLTCTYKNYTYDEQDASSGSGDSSDSQQEIEIATMSWEFSGQALTLPNRYLVWKDAANGGPQGDDTLQLSEVSPVINIPKFDVLLTRHFVSRKPTRAILDNLGRINKSAFRVGRDVYEPGCLRFDSCQMSQRLTNKGLKYYDMTYRFGVMGVYDTFTKDDGTHELGYVTWNRIYDPKTCHFRKPVWFNDQSRGIYQYDEDGRVQVINGQDKTGFNLLFNPRAT